MSNFKRLGGVLGGQAIDVNSTAQNHELGECVQARDVASTEYGDAEFIYLLGVASTVVGSVVLYGQDNYATSLLVADDIGEVAVAMSACVAGEYGWYQRTGKAVAKGLASLADNAEIYGTSTAGSVDDAVVAGDRVQRAKSASAIGTPSAGLFELECDRPYVTNGVAA